MKRLMWISVLLGPLSSGLLPAQIVPNSANWSGGAGNWSQANWIYAEPLTPTVPPLPIPYPDLIYGFAFVCDIGGSQVNVSIPITVADMEVDNGGELSIENVPFAVDALAVAGGTLRNDGSVVIRGGGSLRGTIGLPLFILGDGGIELRDDASRLGEIGIVDNGGNRISGDGAIVGGGFNNDNGGVVIADRLGDSLTVEAILVDNDGTFTALNGGRVVVDPVAIGEFNNTGSLVEAVNGGSVEISDTDMSGGIGEARMVGIISFDDTEIDGVALRADDRSTIRFSGSSELRNENGVVLTNDSVGELFENSVIHGGLLRADATSAFLAGGTPTLSGVMTLEGPLRAQAGLLGFAGLELDNSLGTITVEPGVEMRTAGVNTILGGDLNGEGLFTMTGTTSLGPGSMPLTISELSGSVGPGAELRLLGDLVNETLIEVVASDLRIDTDLQLGGAGTVSFVDAFPGSILAPVEGKDPLLTVGPDQTFTTAVEARGEVTARVHNLGRIESAGAGAVMVYRRDLRNEGHFGARDGGLYELDPGVTIDNVGGTIFGESSGAVRDADGLTIIGGSFAGDGTGVFNAQGLVLLDTIGPDSGNPFGMTVGSGAIIDVAQRGGNPILRLDGTLTNHGTIQIRDLLGTDPTRAAFEPVGTATIEGSGQIRFPGGNTNLLRPGPGGERFVIGAEQTVRTDGPTANGLVQIPVTNFGLFEARGGNLRIQEDMRNAGVLQGVNGGFLRLEGVTVDQVTAGPGLVRPQPDGTTWMSMSTVVGGRVGGGTSGSIAIIDEVLFDAVGPDPNNPVGFTVDSGTTLDVSLSGSGADPTLDVKGGLTLDGTVLLRDFIGTDGGQASLGAVGDATLLGTGEVLFGPGDEQWVEAAGPGASFRFGPDLTVRTTPGSKGRILLPVTNEGRIEARAGLIDIQEDLVNDGTVASTEGGSLTLRTLTVDSTSGGLLEVEAGSTFDLESCELTGASFTGDGTIRFGGTSYLAATAPNSARVFPETTVQVGQFAGASLELTGTLQVDGALELRSPASFTPRRSDLIINGDGILTGSGITKLGFAGQSKLGQSIRPLGEDDSLTIAATHLVRTNGPSSSGSILLDTVNVGTLQAMGGQLSIFGDNGILARPLVLTNRGLLRATDSGQLRLNEIEFDQTGGGVTSVEAGSSAHLEREVRLRGGTFGGDGTYFVGSPTHVHDEPLIDEEALFRLGGSRSSDLILHSDLVLNGQIDLNGVDGFGGFIAADLVADGTRSIRSTSPDGALITYGGTAPVDFRPAGALDPSDQLVFGQGIEIRGAPQSELLLAVPIENRGILEVDGGRITAQVSPQTNRGTISLRSGGRLDVRQDVTIDNDSGVLEVDASSLVSLGFRTTLAGGLVSGEGRVETSVLATLGPGTHLATRAVDVTRGSLTVSDQFTNDSRLRLRGRQGFGGQIPARLVLDSDTVVDGDGSIEGFSDRFNSIVGANGVVPLPRLTLGSGQSLETAPGHVLQCFVPVECAGSLVAAGEITFSSGCLVTESGVVRGGGTLRMNGGAALEVDGAVRPGNSAGTLTVLGALQLGPTASTEIEIGGGGAGQFDRITVSGSAGADGLLKVRLVDGYVPPVDATFTILTGNGVTGGFSAVEVDAAGSRRNFEVEYTPNAVVLTARLRTYAIYEEWAADQFTPAERLDAAVSGKDADPDSDGLSNFREYVHGLPPKVASPDPFVLVGTELAGDPAVRQIDTRFPWADGMTDADYLIERADLPGSWLPTVSPVHLESDLGGYRLLTLRTTLPAPVPTRTFLRLRMLR